MGVHKTIVATLTGLTAAAVLFSCGAAQGPTDDSKSTAKRSGTSVIVADHGRGAPRMNFGGLRLLMPQAEVVAFAQKKGWQLHDDVPAEGSVELTPVLGHAAASVKIRLEAKRIVQISVTFRQPDASRADMRHDYARSMIQADGSWAMTDPLRRTLVVITSGGRALVATHLAATRDRTGAKALLARYLKE